MTIIDLTPEEFRCAATMSCPRVLVREACGDSLACPAVLEGKPDTLIIIGKVVLDSPEIDDIVGCGEDAVEIDLNLVRAALAKLEEDAAKSALQSVTPPEASQETREADEDADW